MSSKEEIHNKGQEDGHNGEYNRPHQLFDDLTAWPSEGMKKNIEENRAYDDGYCHARGQDDAKSREYNPPSDPDDRKAYDAGYDNGLQR